MKKLILLICLFAGISAYSQPYQAVLGKDTTQWNYISDCFVSDLYYTVIFKAFGDTIINNISYRILTEKEYLNGSNSVYGYIREDTVSGRLWLLKDSVEYKLYDMSLKKNDTMFFTKDSVILRVANIYIENNKKIIEFDDETTLIEGIGSTINIYNYIEHCGISSLLCSFKDQIQTWHNKQYNDCVLYLLKNDELSYDQKYSVDIEKDNIKICSDESIIHSIKIYNLNGSLLFSSEPNENNTIIPIKKFIKGFYILIINNENVAKFNINK